MDPSHRAPPNVGPFCGGDGESDRKVIAVFGRSLDPAELGVPKERDCDQINTLEYVEAPIKGLPL